MAWVLAGRHSRPTWMHGMIGGPASEEAGTDIHKHGALSAEASDDEGGQERHSQGRQNLSRYKKLVIINEQQPIINRLNWKQVATVNVIGNLPWNRQLIRTF